MNDSEYITTYPNLFIHVIRGHWGVYVKRNNRDAEAICHYQPSTDELEHMNKEAGLALQDGWFYCSGCEKAYPRTEYGYFYFAGNYCNKCKDGDPEGYRRAMNESYN